MNSTLQSWNLADESEAFDAMIACCGARRFAEGMVALRPIENVIELSDAADRVWNMTKEADWLQAFACHPRIGDRTAAPARKKSAEWSMHEQASVSSADEDVLKQLADANHRYEERFGFTYIVCATGKSAEEMLAILNRRLANDRLSELREAAEQQRQITQIRLGKWLVE